MFRKLFWRAGQLKATFLSSATFHLKTAKFASLFLASSIIYNYSNYKIIQNARRVLPNEFLTTEDVDDGPADWTPDGKRIMTVCITGAAGFLSYNFLPHLINGSVFGPNVQIRLRLLDVPGRVNELRGIALELADSIPYNLESVKYGSDPKKLFRHCDLIVFIGGRARTQGMTRSDLLQENSKVYREHGKALNEVAKKEVRCVVVANPTNTNCMILQDNAPKIPPENFTCLTRLDQNRAIAKLARKTNILPDEIENVVVWGNHSQTIYPDVNNAKLQGRPIRQVIYDDTYLDQDFVKHVQRRADEILETEKEHPSIMSGARALSDHIRDWWQGTEPGRWVSMGVVSDGSYGVPKGMVFSFPVTTKYFRYNIAEYPVLSWRSMFIDIANQLAEFDAEDAMEIEQEGEDVIKQNIVNADKEEVVTIEVVQNKLNITYQNVEKISLAFYRVDLEVLFSRSPFITKEKDEFSYIQPNETQQLQIVNSKSLEKIVYEIPQRLQKYNLYIELRTPNKTLYETFFSTSLQVHVIESFGQVKVLDLENKPLTKVYVKCFARTNDGNVVFYKDGYTDLRGRFDYATLNSNNISNIKKFAIFVSSDELGSLVKEVKAPEKLGRVEKHTLNKVKKLVKA